MLVYHFNGLDTTLLFQHFLSLCKWNGVGTSFKWIVFNKVAKIFSLLYTM